MQTIVDRVKDGLICQVCGEEMLEAGGRPVTCNQCAEKARAALPPPPDRVLFEQVKRLDARELACFTASFAMWLVERGAESETTTEVSAGVPSRS